MTPQELELLELSKELWNKYLQLPKQHINDAPDINFHINAIQMNLFARPGYREYLKTDTANAAG